MPVWKMHVVFLSQTQEGMDNAILCIKVLMPTTSDDGRHCQWLLLMLWIRLSTRPLSSHPVFTNTNTNTKNTNTNTKTRSSWLNCALRDDEAVYWVSIGHYEAVAVGNWWYWVSRGHLCLYILHKVEIWTGVTDAWLTDSLTHWQTLKDRATQLLKKYSGALVTQQGN